MTRDRRQADRVLTQLPADMRGRDGVLHPARCYDVSRTGMFLRCTWRPPVGTVVAIDVFTGGQVARRLAARIVRHTPEGIGLHFEPTSIANPEVAVRVVDNGSAIDSIVAPASSGMLELDFSAVSNSPRTIGRRR